MCKTGAVHKFTVTANGIMDAVVKIRKQGHLSIFQCIKLVIFVETIILHIGAEEGHFSL